MKFSSLNEKAQGVVDDLLSRILCPELKADIVEVASWAENNGGAGKVDEVIAWLAYEGYGLSKDEAKYWAGEWVKGTGFAYRPEWMNFIEDDEQHLRFPPQVSLCEKWLALHEIRERIFVGSNQILLDAWAWRLHKDEGKSDPMEIFSFIIGEFPVEAWRYPTTDPENFELPWGDTESIEADAKLWQQ